MDNHWRCRRCSPTAKSFNPAPASMACSGLMGCPVPIFYLTRDGPTRAAGKLEGPRNCLGHPPTVQQRDRRAWPDSWSVPAAGQNGWA